ncbi:MAG: trigger factor [Deltaproteobacteria bacterium CG_4_8_14_3_um_filter_51_11]|nr:trigger factor [bacterium]OIP43962.1 MAG: trigger factor [Desulfobacteraceae bacterium CG2_30_51_40]PIP45059.1 MAG: trigger factor [Deltaproteobacteria bacterium CG23_combo_of_CG06-09_8_20_14_all_51_20]PIX18415.1 MAG: trigger factor [Deltaproteobacteria bacterium CG_4_8_14_3_um_filter_51_11]PIY26818.1 MAG: trigger factor [Deltaproteobacteria bacterium CG_4_10_14_3_um_filter_51_14]
MKVSLEEINPTKKRLIVEMTSEEVGPRMEKAFKDASNSVRIPGFRPGKAPRRVIESFYGEKIKEDLSRNLVTESLPKAIEELQVRPLTMPVLEKSFFSGTRNFNYTAIMDVYPSFVIGDYKGIEIEKQTVTVSDEDVDRQINYIRESHGKLNSIEDSRPSQKGDFLLIEYQGFEDEKPLMDMNSSNLLLHLGSAEFHPSFDDALLGLKKGEKKEFTVEFENTFNRPAFAGKKVLFKIEVQDVKELQLAQLDDEFVKGLNAEIKTVDYFRAAVKKEMLEQAEKRAEAQAKRAVIEKICEGVDLALPDILVEAENSSAVEEILSNITRNGATLEKVGVSREKLSEEMRPLSEKRVKEMLVIEEIASRENIDVDQEEVDHEFAMIAASTGQDAAEIKKYYAQGGMLGAFTRKLREGKTLNYLLQHAKIHEVKNADSAEGTVVTSQ